MNVFLLLDHWFSNWFVVFFFLEYCFFFHWWMAFCWITGRFIDCVVLICCRLLASFMDEWLFAGSLVFSLITCCFRRLLICFSWMNGFFAGPLVCFHWLFLFCRFLFFLFHGWMVVFLLEQWFVHWLVSVLVDYLFFSSWMNVCLRNHWLFHWFFVFW